MECNLYKWKKGFLELKEYPDFEDLKGAVFVSVKREDDSIIFADAAGNRWMLYHEDECCEQVYIESIVGELSDLENSPILLAEESRDNAYNDENEASETWTFYKLATIKGYVDIRFFGTSNGYYSESAQLILMKKDYDE